LYFPGFILIIEWLEKRGQLNRKDAASAGHTYLLLSHGVTPPHFTSTLGKLLELLQCAQLGLSFDERRIEKEVGSGCTLRRLEILWNAD
jgi:hypothetical protein